MQCYYYSNESSSFMRTSIRLFLRGSFLKLYLMRYRLSVYEMFFQRNKVL